MQVVWIYLLQRRGGGGWGAGVRMTETLTGMDKTWGRPWSTLWPTLWPAICIWPTGGQIFKNIKIKSARVEQVR